jgi:hypothetical protein
VETAETAKKSGKKAKTSASAAAGADVSVPGGMESFRVRMAVRVRNEKGKIYLLSGT